MEAVKAGSPLAKERDLDNIAAHGLRPVRKEASRHSKRHLIMSNEPVGWRKPIRLEGTQEESYSIEDHVVPKSEEERASILQAIKTNFLFEHTTEKQNKVGEARRADDTRCASYRTHPSDRFFLYIFRARGRVSHSEAKRRYATNCH